MPRALAESVAASLDAEPALAPLFGVLTAGLPNLGGSSSSVVRLLRRTDLEPRSRVLDLGCGRGGPSIAVGRAFGCFVTGVDGCAEFLTGARTLAARRGIASRCRFIHADIRRWRTRDRFDAAMLIACGQFVGSLADQVRLARRAVRPGGWIVIDDAFPSGPPRISHLATRLALESLGDRLIAQVVRPARIEQERERRLTTILVRRAAALERKHPSLRGELRRFGATQQASGRETGWRAGLFLLRRGPR